MRGSRLATGGEDMRILTLTSTPWSLKPEGQTAGRSEAAHVAVSSCGTYERTKVRTTPCLVVSYVGGTYRRAQ